MGWILTCCTYCPLTQVELGNTESCKSFTTGWHLDFHHFRLYSLSSHCHPTLSLPTLPIGSNCQKLLSFAWPQIQVSRASTQWCTTSCRTCFGWLSLPHSPSSQPVTGCFGIRERHGYWLPTMGCGYGYLWVWVRVGTRIPMTQGTHTHNP